MDKDEQMQVFLNAKEVQRRYNISPATLYTWIGQKQFPQPYKLGRSSRWRLSELADWEDQQPRGVEREDVARLHRTPRPIKPMNGMNRPQLPEKIRQALQKVGRK